MIAVRAVGGLVHPGAIEGIEGDLTTVIKDFERAMDVEALRRIKETGEHLFLTEVHSQLLRSQSGSFCSGGSDLSRRTTASISAVSTALADSSSIKS